MNHTQYAGALRQALVKTLGANALISARATRLSPKPFEESDSQWIGTLRGYRYRVQSSQAAMALGLPGELAGDEGSEWFMDLTAGLAIQIAEDDTLTFSNGDSRRVSLVRGSGGFTGKDIYRLYKLEAV